MYDLAVSILGFPVPVAVSTSELIGVGVTFVFMLSLLAGALLFILKAYGARNADEQLRQRVGALEREVESLRERLKGDE